MSETIKITQLDPVSGYFNKIDANGVANQKPSTEYNNPLATWAMELSYKAYNPYSGLLASVVPGAFMNDETGTAWDALQQSGFSDIKHFNYGIDTGDDKDEVDNVSIIGHTVGHRNINVINNNTGGSNNANRLDFLNDNVRNSVDIEYPGLHSEILSESILTSNNYDNTLSRPLIALVVRGTVKPSEWLLDFSEILRCRQSQYGSITQSAVAVTGKEIIYYNNTDKFAQKAALKGGFYIQCNKF